MKIFIVATALLFFSSCIQQTRIATSTITPKPSTVSIPATETRLMLGTRWEIAEFFNELFGADTLVDARYGRNWKVSDITRQQILEQPVSWGGPCDPYAAVYDEPRDVGWAIWPSRPAGYVEPSRACVESKTSKESLLPGGSSSRFAWTIRACDYFTSIDETLKVAVTHAGGSAGTINTPPTDAQIRNAYDLFHPGVPLPPEVFSALKNVVTTAASTYPNSPDAWRFLMFTLCSSPSWQIL